VELQNSGKIDELKYDKGRLHLLTIVTVLSFILYLFNNGHLSTTLLHESTLLAGLTVLSLIHYFVVLHYPAMLKRTRRVFLLFLDLALLTYSITIFEHYGLFLFPLYIILIMQNGLYFGIPYFYSGLITASGFWIAMLYYSQYWQHYSDIVATFAATTFLVPLFYLNYIISAHREKDALSKKLSTVAEDAYHDSLTSLANRKTYTEELKRAFKEKKFFALLFIDLNKFKNINDTYGHHIGDEVLIEVARRLEAQMDEEDFLARLGGDEFAIISKKKKVFLPKFIQRIEEHVIGAHQIEKITVRIELSIGISMYPDDARSSTILEKYADTAMYAAKKKRESHHVFYGDTAPKHKPSYSW